MTKLTPKYSVWEAIQAALGAAMKALAEVRATQKALAAMMDGAIGIDHVDIEHDGERTFTITFAKGELRRSKSFTLPAVIDRGVYKEGTAYQTGDGVTWGGSFWIAQKATDTKPGDGDGWRLAVKRGRDGRDGKDGNPPEPPKPVKVR